MRAAGWAASVPVDPDRGTALGWAWQELTDRVYARARPGLLERAWAWAGDRLDDLSLPPGPGSGWGLALLLLSFALVGGVTVWKVGPGRRSARTTAPQDVFAATTASAREHRVAADAHAAQGHWALAVRERFRALVRALEERTVLDERPGRTADEAAAEAARALPDQAGELTWAARLFDEVVYGGRPATAGDDRRLTDLDARAAASRPVLVER